MRITLEKEEIEKALAGYLAEHTPSGFELTDGGYYFEAEVDSEGYVTSLEFTHEAYEE